MLNAEAQPLGLVSYKNMSQWEHTHLAHYKHFCFYCKFKFNYSEILRVATQGHLCFWVRSSLLRIPDNILPCFPVNLCQIKWPIIFNYAFWSFYFY